MNANHLSLQRKEVHPVLARIIDEHSRAMQFLKKTTTDPSKSKAEAGPIGSAAPSNTSAAAKAEATRALREQPENTDPVSAVEEEVRLVLDAHPGTVDYTVEQGDSFGRIAGKKGIPTVYISRLNPGVDSRKLKPGDVLRVPSKEGIASLPYTQMDLGEVPEQEQYEPGSESWDTLFTRAAELAGVSSWMENDTSRQALEDIFTGGGEVAGENPGGWVMQPNERYGSRNRPENRAEWPEIRDELREGRIEGQDHVRRSARSSATGLGQLLVSNLDAYAPGGRASMGDPLGEAIAMLEYIKDRYGSPEKAWQEKLATSVY